MNAPAHGAMGRLLSVLADADGRFISYADLISAVYGAGAENGLCRLQSCIARLGRRLSPGAIQCVSDEGYTLDPDAKLKPSRRPRFAPATKAAAAAPKREPVRHGPHVSITERVADPAAPRRSTGGNAVR